VRVIHLGADELALYVAGEPARAAYVEAHAAVCPECAARLAREAALELAIEEVVERGALPARPAVRRGLYGGILAAAALLLVLLGRSLSAPSPERQESAGAIDDYADAGTTLARDDGAPL
jgi:hypothetical protein